MEHKKPEPKKKSVKRAVSRKKHPPLAEDVAKRVCEKYGRPYWKDANDKRYPKGEISNDEWRWEFLRRDADYQEDWQKLCMGEIEYIHPQNIFDYSLRQLEDPKKSYKQLTSKMVFLRYPMIMGKHDEVEWYHLDVAESNSDQLEDIINFERDRDDLVTVKFDLNRPLSPQFEQLKRPLESKQKKLKEKVLRLRVSDAPVLYLRTLDALFLGIDHTTIGKEIFGCTTNPSAATRGKQAARKVKKMWRYF